jgi:hypothetical protein
VRKRIRRYQPTLVTRYIDRIVRVHVPTHPETGMPLDRRTGASEMDQIEDTRRVDAYAAARRRTMLAREMWKPMAAGAAGAALVVLAAYAGAYMAIPTFKSKIVEIPVLDVTHTPVTVPDISMMPVDIPVPRVTAALPPKTPERKFVERPDFRSAPYHGRIFGIDGRALSLTTAAGLSRSTAPCARTQSDSSGTMGTAPRPAAITTAT